MSGVPDLLRILDLEQIELNVFRGRSPDIGWSRVFGGQVVAQALVAASRTVAGRKPHSIHAYFLLPGDPAAAILYEVERIRDGRSFTTRRCVAIQHGQPIFSLSASFHEDEPGFEHSFPMPPTPSPESLASLLDLARLGGERGAELVRVFGPDRPFDIRPVYPERYGDSAVPGPGPFARQSLWIRAERRLPDDPAIHRAVLAYLSDMTLLDSALVCHGRTIFDPRLQVASLDHSIWLHRPFRADEWLLYDQDSPSAVGARALARGLIFTRDGRLVASICQEGLIRRRESR